MIKVCRACDEPITDEADAVAVLHELGNSGPGYTVWAHRRHAEDVPLIEPVVLDLMLRLWAAGS